MVNEQFEFLLDVSKLIIFSSENGFVLTGGELWRTTEQQQIYFDSGKSKTMKSNHLRRLAIDFNVFKNGTICNKEEMIELGNYWEGLHSDNRWGGNFVSILDTPHFEKNLQQ